MDPQNPNNQQKPTAENIYPPGQEQESEGMQTPPLSPVEPQKQGLPPEPPKPEEQAFLQTENPLYQAPSEPKESYFEPPAEEPQSTVSVEAPAQPAQGLPNPPKEAGEVPAATKDAGTPVFASAGEKGGGHRKFPIKNALLGLIALVLLGGAAIGANMFFFSKKAPVGPKGPVELVYWGLWEDSSTIAGLISEYESKNKNVKIKYLKQSKEDYRERLANSLAKGAGPDIFRFHNTWVPILSSQLASLPPAVMDAATYQKTFYPVAAGDLRRGADIVGIPLMFDGLGLYINENIFGQAGKSPPGTWDELRKLALELTIRDQSGRIEQAGAALGRTENVDHWEDILALMMLQNGADLANPTGKLAEDSLAFFTVFAKQDGVWDKTMPPSTQAFAAGKLAMYFGPSWRAFEIKTLNPGVSFRVVPVPQLPKTRPTDPDITWASYWAEGVWSKSKYQKETWEFLRFLASKDSLQEMYQLTSQSRLFGPPYPLPEMAGLLKDDPVVGAFVSQASTSKSWYLASRTFDGATGINSRISAYFQDAVNSVAKAEKDPKEALETVASGVRQVLSSYQVTR